MAWLISHRVSLLSLGMLCVAAVQAIAQQPTPGARYIYPGAGRPAADQVPQLPAEVLSQLPPGCTTAWQPQDGSPARLGAPQPSGSAREVRRPLRLGKMDRINDALHQATAPSAARRYAMRMQGSDGGGEAVLPPPGEPAGDDLLLGAEPVPAPEGDAAGDLLGGDPPPAAGGDLLGGGEDLLGGEGDPLAGMGPSEAYNPHAGASQATQPAPRRRLGEPDPHLELCVEGRYPSALTCAKCHPKHFDEWKVSAHAYSFVSPMFQRFEQKIIDLTQGTVGTFCVRCHGPVAIQMDLGRPDSMLDAPQIVREGITCIACHRVNEAYGRTNGSRRIEPGDIYQPVYGGGNGQGVARAISQREKLKVKIDPNDQGPGQAIHTEGRYFAPITRSDFCASCHQVAVHPGIWLEIVHHQYRASPAAKRGVSCQDCHMGAVPGKAEGYEYCQIAELGGKPWGEVRKHANHTFWGPNYPISHPGLYPINPKADRWTMREWLRFDYKSGWGTEAFERDIAPGLQFPPPWDNADDRRDARRIVEANQEAINAKRALSIETMEGAIGIEGPRFDGLPQAGTDLKFRYRISNLSDGHNLMTGSLGAQPQVWFNVALIGPQGNRLWESGYLDSNGDLADLQSEDVNNDRLPRDAQLFNLQTKFLVNGLRGTDREVAVPLNFNFDQLVFLRPGAVPVTVLNHPPLIRMEAHSIPPLGSRDAKYRIPAMYLRQRGVYRLSVRMRSRPEPPYFMRLVDSTPEMIRQMNEGILDMHTQTYPFIVR